MPASASLVPLGEGAVHWPEDRPPSQEGSCNVEILGCLFVTKPLLSMCSLRILTTSAIPLGMLICAVTRRHNLLGFGSADMRAPIRNDTIAAVRRISAATVTDDGMIGNVFCQWERVHDFHERVVRRKCVDAVWHSV